MKIYINIDDYCSISFGKLFDIDKCICVIHSELNLEEEFYFPKTNISKNLQHAYKKFGKRMKLKVYSE